MVKRGEGGRGQKGASSEVGPLEAKVKQLHVAPKQCSNMSRYHLTTSLHEPWFSNYHKSRPTKAANHQHYRLSAAGFKSFI